ncbi:hypothetical protein FACS1894120_0950 [Clostridia bacterium]|nr:hypothetical protein FACS1894120_0950 [Clostridia bacterium]
MKKKADIYHIIFSVLLAGSVAFCLSKAFLLQEKYVQVSVSDAVPSDEEFVTAQETTATVPAPATPLEVAETEPEETSAATTLAVAVTETEPAETTEITSAEAVSTAELKVSATAAKSADTGGFPLKYKDKNISIKIEKIRKYETDIYVADVKLSSLKYLKTAFAKDTYGRNVTAATSVIANKNDAIFAVNGDYYGFDGGGIPKRQYRRPRAEVCNRCCGAASLYFYSV